MSANAIGRGESGDSVVAGQGVGIVTGGFVVITAVVGTGVTLTDVVTAAVVGLTLIVKGGLSVPYAYFS